MDAWHKKLTEGVDFDDKEFYSALGFKCGLEIHQQLNTKKKLFCHCPVGYRNDEPDAVILRHMRPTLSEMGTYDGTALMEFKTKKQVIYQLYRDNVCTYEMDDTPPFPINQEALDYAIEIALMLNCQLVDEVHITRKQYLDGSIPTGFQRTAIIGVNGWIPYRGRKVRIQQLALEEDACREVEDKGHTIIFRTDRLSTPLIEIVTKPDMFTPHEAAEVDELLGRLLRASGRVRRGIGSARQDVNVSIAGSDRVEIKGVPRTPDIRALTHYEALRHKALLELKEKLAEKGITAESFSAREVDVTSLMTNSTSERLSARVKRGNVVKAVVLEGWDELLRHKTQPGLTFANEIAGRVRVIACLDEMPNMFILDEKGEGIGLEEEVRLRKAIKASSNDAVVLVWGTVEDAKTAADEVIARAKEATEFVPQETRQHMPDACRTDFERILPGPDRMYPDTDSPPIALARERVERIAKDMAPRPWEREERYQNMDIPQHLAKELAIDTRARLFDRLVDKIQIEPGFLAEVLISWRREITRDMLEVGLNPPYVSDENLERFLTLVSERNTPRYGVYVAFERLLYGEFQEPPSPLNEEELEVLCKKVKNDFTDIAFKTRDLKLDFLTGEAIKQSAGKAEPEKARKLLEII
ncbi:Glu-tRNA(Gln) amidotransferase subunit GatE [bacterium]|nr:Glu-tRNA(Gln) amidotransferase subunit GatE [bacterium]